MGAAAEGHVDAFFAGTDPPAVNHEKGQKPQW
jgi:hypothetical protein